MKVHEIGWAYRKQDLDQEQEDIKNSKQEGEPGKKEKQEKSQSVVLDFNDSESQCVYEKETVVI